MKKLIAMAMVAMSVNAFAVSSWDYFLGSVEAVDGTSSTTGYSAYIIDKNDLTGATIAGVGDVFSWVYDNYGTSAWGDLAKTTMSPTEYVDGYVGFKNYTDTLTGDASDYYLVAFYESGSSTLGNVLSSDAGYKGNLGFGVTSSPTASGWQAVPEPTSAMLMLLGVGLVALKRRRV